MNFDPTVTIPCILAVCAIVSPIAVAIINNCHQTKLKKIELAQEEIHNTLVHKRDILENYLSSASQCIHYPDGESSKKYGEAYSLALMFVSGDTAVRMSDLDNLIRHHKYDAASDALPVLAPKIYEVAQWQTSESKCKKHK